MSIQSQVLFPSNVDIISLVRALEKITGLKITAQAARSTGYWTIIFENYSLEMDTIHVFTNYACDELNPLDIGIKTLVTVPYSPNNYAVICALAVDLGGAFRKSEGDEWQFPTIAR